MKKLKLFSIFEFIMFIIIFFYITPLAIDIFNIKYIYGLLELQIGFFAFYFTIDLSLYIEHLRKKSKYYYLSIFRVFSILLLISSSLNFAHVFYIHINQIVKHLYLLAYTYNAIILKFNNIFSIVIAIIKYLEINIYLGFMIFAIISLIIVFLFNLLKTFILFILKYIDLNNNIFPEIKLNKLKSNLSFGFLYKVYS